MASVSTRTRQVKPLLSYTREEARRRALSLYKNWYRQIPELLLTFDIPKTRKECLKKLREEFRRHDHVTDLRTIDMLIIKGQMDFQEAAMQYKTTHSLMNYWKETVNKKPTDFMSKFLSGQD